MLTHVSNTWNHLIQASNPYTTSLQIMKPLSNCTKTNKTIMMAGLPKNELDVLGTHVILCCPSRIMYVHVHGKIVAAIEPESSMYECNPKPSCKIGKGILILSLSLALTTLRKNQASLVEPRIAVHTRTIYVLRIQLAVISF